MVVRLIPKSRLLPRAVNLRALQKPCWSPPRWSESQANGNTRFHSSGVHQQQQQNSQNKGMKKRWRWRSVLSILDWWCLAAGTWITWRGVLTRWTPLGIVFIVALQLRHRGKKQQDAEILATKLEVQCYSTIPLRIFSRCFGWLADCPVPSPLRPIVFGAYSTTFGVNMSEAAFEDFKHYRSLAQFFAREIKPEVRPIDPVSALVSPCDGRVMHCGLADSAYIEQVKGVSYRLDCFLGPQTWRETENLAKDSNKNQKDIYIEPFHKTVLHSQNDTALFQCVIYLAPGDYHRFHSPTSWTPKFRRHIPGELLSVNPSIARWIPGLFCLNERVHYIGSWKHGFFCFTAVGATNVGSVSVYIDEKLRTNRWHGWKYCFTNWSRPITGHLPDKLPRNETTLAEIKLGKGELIGHFNMGSTIVLIFEAPKNFKFTIKPGETVKMGQRMGSVGKLIERITMEEKDEFRSEHSI